MQNLKELFSDKLNTLYIASQHSKDVHIWEDLDKNVVFVSPSCEKILGYLPNDFIDNPKLFESLIFPEDLKIWKERCDDIFNSDIQSIEFRVIHKSGEVVWLEHDSHKVYDNNNNCIGYFSSNRVITKQKMTNQIIDTSSSILFLWRNEENYPVDFVSSNVERILGYSIEEFLSGSITYTDIIYPDCQERVNKEISVNIATRPKQFKHEPYRLIRKDNSIIWVRDYTVIHENKKGQITHFYGIIKDITKQYETELELKQSEQRLLYSLEAANIGSWELNLESNKFCYSKMVKELFQLNNGEFLETLSAFLEYIHDEDRAKVETLIKDAVKENSSFEIEYRIICPDGKIKWMLQQGQIFTDVNGKNSKMYGIIRDVSARVSSLSTLVESERRFKSFVENSPNGIVIHLDRKILYANNMAKSLLKVAPDDKYLGGDITKFLHRDEIEIILTKLKDVTGSIRKKPFFETRFVREDGQILNVALASSIVEYQNSKAIQTVFYDITKAKKTQEDLLESEERYRNVFIQAPLGILHFDKEGNITDCNEEFAGIIGTTREALIGFNMLSRLKDEELKVVVKNCLTTGTGYYQNYYTSVLTGKVTPAICRFNAIYSDHEEIVGGVGLVENISERVKNEKLQKTLFHISQTASTNLSMEELYIELHKIIKELMPADNFYVAMHNTETNIISFPFHIDEYDEHPEPQKFGKGLTEYILRTKQSMIITGDLDKELQAQGEVELSGEFSQVWVGVFLEFEGIYNGVLVVQDYNNVNAYSEEDLKVLQFVSEQIIKVLDKKYADRRLSESIEALSKAKKELEVINKNKDRFFSIIAHDLRAPFNTLLGVSQMISGDLDGMTMKEVKEISSVIHSSTENLFKLIENLLNWSRLQMGSFKTNPEKLDLLDVVLDNIEVVKYSANNKDIVVNNKVDKLFVYADEECVKTVLRNLLNNAVKFTHRGGDIIITSEQYDDKVKLTIEDNGVGMDNEIAEGLFDITKKKSTVGTENEKGTGLGLILCKDLVEKNNGEIWVETEYGKGSKFSFTLPSAGNS